MKNEPIKNENAPGGTGTPSTETVIAHDNDSLPSGAESVNNCFRLRELRELTGIQAKTLTALVRDERFPGFNRSLFSNCESPEKYGVIPHPDVIRIICEAYGIELNATAPAPARKRKAGKRKLSRRITLRMTERDYAWLQTQLKKDDYPTVQSWFYAKIKEWRANEEGSSAPVSRKENA